MFVFIKLLRVAIRQAVTSRLLKDVCAFLKSGYAESQVLYLRQWGKVHTTESLSIERFALASSSSLLQKQR